ncbi:MAG: hypothetical protein GC149_16340 [Gammaproteobacteria bacterium]|nr:hypothetical protein [Gammaproteobacteria bacterium]
MQEIDPNMIVPAVFGIAGTVVGAVVTGASVFLSEWWKDKKKSAQIRASLIAEVDALVEIANKREYLQGLLKTRDYLKTQPEGTRYSYTVRIPDHYSRIYQANADSIGSIDSETACKIVQFHQFVDAVVQDVLPGGSLHVGGNIDNYEQTANILEHALNLGREISNDK